MKNSSKLDWERISKLESQEIHKISRIERKNILITENQHIFQNVISFLAEKFKNDCYFLAFLELLLGALEDFTLRILIVASFVSIGISVGTEEDHRETAWIEGFAIFMAVLISSMIQASNDYQKEKQFQKLNKVADDRKKVLIVRNGEVINIHQELVLTGDIIHLSEGMEIPADGLLFEASEVTCDESAMTGETNPIKKKVLRNCIEERNKIVNQGGKNKAQTRDVSSPILLSGTRVTFFFMIYHKFDIFRF